MNTEITLLRMLRLTILSLTWVCLSVSPVFVAQKSAGSTNPTLIPYRKGAWGFCDVKRKVIIEPKYGSASRFSEGLAAVELEGKWGFVDKSGQEVIPLKYDLVLQFSE